MRINGGGWGPVASPVFKTELRGVTLRGWFDSIPSPPLFHSRFTPFAGVQSPQLQISLASLTEKHHFVLFQESEDQPHETGQRFFPQQIGDAESQSLD